MGYQRRVKGYRLWSIEPNNQKILISRDVVFIEHKMPFLEKKADSISDAKNSADDYHFEVEGNTHTTDTDAEDVQSEIPDIQGAGDVQDAGDIGGLATYQLARDKVRRQNVRPPARYKDTEMLFFALHVAEQIELAEPQSYAEAC